MLKKLYDWTLSLSSGKYAPWALFGVSFAESSFFPIPPDPILIPMILANPRRVWWYAALCTIASVLGGFLGYAIGAFFFETVGQWLIHAYGMADKLDHFNTMYNQYGFWIILLKGLTPIPYKLVTIASGFAHYDLFWFTVASMGARGMRFFAVALLLRIYGDKIKDSIERNLGLSFFILLFFMVIGFVIVKYV